MIQLKRILAPTDFSERSISSIVTASDFASQFDAELQILHVVYNPYPYGGGAYEAVVDSRPQLKAAARKQLENLPGPPWEGLLNISRHVRFGHATVEILAHSMRHDIDLIVQNTHGRTGLSRFLIGSVAENVVRKAACPVLTVRGTGNESAVPKKILVATDFGMHSENALRYAAEFAERFGAELHVLHAATEHITASPAISFHDDLDVRARRPLEALCIAKSHPTVTLHKELRIGPAVGTILDYVKEFEIDLVVVGSHGRNALVQVLIGGVAERVVRHAPCSVLTVHHPEHEFVKSLANAELACL
ncbi:MAG: universal stress protein [Planctomycetota bacterium]|nr:universal stress protein [Planctomycetota bacterium]